MLHLTVHQIRLILTLIITVGVFGEMAEVIKPFLCDAIDKSLLRHEWEKWLRSFTLYLAAEEITEDVKRKNKLLHLGGPQLQEVVFNIPGALVETDEKNGIKSYDVLVGKLNEYFSPKRNTTFERHLFRNITPIEGESFNKFLLRLRQQVAKCSFGKTKEEIEEISIKDKLIDSWAPLDLKKRLLEKEQSLAEIVDACQVYEQISKTSRSLLSNAEKEQVNKISTKVNSQSNPSIECSRCGRKGHLPSSFECPAKNAKCNKCSLLGHFAIRCRTKKRRIENNYNGPYKRNRTSANVRCVKEEEDRVTSEIREFGCFKIGDNRHNEENICCTVGGTDLMMVIDSGCRLNLISEKDWNLLQNSEAVMWNIRSHSVNKFKAYAASYPLEIVVVFDAPICVGNRNEIMSSFYVIKNGNQSLLGRETALSLNVLKLGLDVNHIHEREQQRPFPKVHGIKVTLSIDHTVKPVQQPVRRVPVALEGKVSNKIDEAVRLDIIEPVFGPSKWISPIVIAFKGNDDIRLCVDMRCANRAILRENYPLPTFESFMSKLKAARIFSRLDLKSAYHQLELDESSREITTFVTHKGLFRYKRLMFGVNSAPEIFQKIMEGMLSTCPNVLNYIDDIIVFGSCDEDHDAALKSVLDVLKENNVTLNQAKCVRKTKKLMFLGHVLSADGFTADPEKVKVIQQFRSPESKEEVRSFLGLVTYIGKFLPDLADLTDPLRILLTKDAKFVWGRRQEEAFLKLKTMLSEIPNLSYFDPKLRTRVIADASPVALGAVLVQFNNNGEPRIISFASKSLSAIEKRYSQTEKESLALVWSVERFYYYLAGLDFELVTDHKPLECIFKPTSKPPARIERWLLRLQAFKFKVIYRAGKDNIADSISRLCKISDESSFDGTCEESIFYVLENTVPSTLTISQISKESTKDIDIRDAISSMENECWDLNISNPYYVFRFELSAIGSILLRGSRIVIPKSLRPKVLGLAHEGHPGESTMKRRLRSKVWWPLIDREAENFVKACRDCLLVSQPSNPTPMQRHPFPNGPWQCLATDLLGPLPNGEYVLVLIDYYSRYQEIVFLKRISSDVIIKAMKEIFSKLGLPRTIRTDNGRQYVSDEFKSFCTENNISVIRTPPYWPQANGEVENMNKSLVKRLKIAAANKRDYKEEIQKFLLMYNVTPHGTTGSAPSELMFNRRIRDKIPGIEEITEEIIDSAARDNDLIRKQKGKEKADSNRNAKDSTIQVGDKVLLKNVIFPNKLTPNFDKTTYEVVERNGSEVKIVGGGRTYTRNISMIKKIPDAQLPEDTAAQQRLGPEPSTVAGEPLLPINDLSSPPVNNQPSSPVTDPQQSRGSDAYPEQGPLKLRLKRVEGMWQH